MKSLNLLAFSAGTLLTLSSCYVVPQPPPPHRHGASIDAPPGGPTRYMDTPPPDAYGVPQQPGAPGEIQAPNPQNPGPITAPPPSVNPAVPSGGSNVVDVPPAPVTPKPPPASGPPYGIKVPNKPGFVYSPFDKTAGIVDVTGFAPGTKVK